MDSSDIRGAGAEPWGELRLSGGCIQLRNDGSRHGHRRDAHRLCGPAVARVQRSGQGAIAQQHRVQPGGFRMNYRIEDQSVYE